MNIVIINETSDLGGAETMALELANALSTTIGNQLYFVSAEGILVKRLVKDVKFFSITRYKPRNIFKIFLEFKIIFCQIKPDIIHSQGATVGIIAGIVAKLYCPKAKVIITHHSVNFTRISGWFGNFLFKIFTDSCIAISKAKYQSLLAGGYNKEKLFLVPNFIDIKNLLIQADEKNICILKQNIGIMPDEKIIVMSGRLIPEKRFDIFIDTLVKTAGLNPRVKVLGLILGDGPQKQQLQDMSDQIKLSNLRVILLGFQTNVAVHLKIANIFLFPSEFQEVLPMCLLEAISMGVPVVCSDITGNNDIIEHGFNGFLVDTDKKNYHTFVSRILSDNDLARKLSFNGMEKSQKIYDKNNIVKDIFTIYKTLVFNRNYGK